MLRDDRKMPFYIRGLEAADPLTPYLNRNLEERREGVKQKNKYKEITHRGKSKEEGLMQKSAWPIWGSARPMELCVLFSKFAAKPGIYAACGFIHNLPTDHDVDLYLSVAWIWIFFMDTNL